MTQPIRADQPNENDFPALYALLTSQMRECAVFFLDPEGRLASWNPGVGHLLGYSESEWVGRPGAIIFTPEDQANGEVEKELGAAARDGQAQDTRWHLRRDGKRIFVDGLMQSVRNEQGVLLGFAKVMRDGTARKRAEEDCNAYLKQAQAEHERLSEVLESISDAFYAVDSEFRFTYVNQRAEEWWGRPRQELIGRHLWTEFPRAVGSEAYHRQLKVMTERKAEHFETVSVLLNRWMGVSIYPNAMGGICCYFQDIAVRKAQEAELQAAYRELEKTAQELRRSNEELTQFARIASHDLKAPLSTISQFAELLMRRYQGRLDEEAGELFQMVIGNATRMQTLLADLMRYAEVTHGAKPVLRPSQANGALANALTNLQGAMQESGAVVTFDLLPPVLIEGTHLVQILQNLIANAILYRKPGTRPEIHVSARPEGERQLFSVRDSGIGIESRFHEKIFEPFKRLHGPEIAGSGIGLAICKKLVEQAGGRIWVESEAGQGAMFFFTLPAA